MPANPGFDVPEKKTIKTGPDLLLSCCDYLFLHSGRVGLEKIMHRQCADIFFRIVAPGTSRFVISAPKQDLAGISPFMFYLCRF